MMGGTRTTLIAVLGAVLIASAGAGSLLLSGAAKSDIRPSSPFPVGEAFTSQEWSKAEASFAAHGFSQPVVVSGMRVRSNTEPFALVRARSRSRGVCFLVVRGAGFLAATCSSNGHLSVPLLVFGANDGTATQPMTAIVGAARPSITGVSLEDSRGLVAGLVLEPTVGGLWSVNGGYGSTKLVLRARGASGRTVATTTLP
jgi:hypothetical protein